MRPDQRVIETEAGLEMLQDIELGLRVSYAVAFESVFPQLAIRERVVEAKWGLRIGGPVAFESVFPQLAIRERVVEAKWGLRIGG